MHSNQLILLFVISYGAATLAQKLEFKELNLRGSCPKINYVSNLNMPRILGWWYRAFSTLDNKLCYKNEGQTMYAAQFDAKTLSVAICCRSAADNNIAACGDNIGSGTVTATDNSGEFIYKFADESINIYVLDTDYDNFAIVYGCTARGRRNRDELIFVLSRQYKLSDELQARVEKALRDNGSDISRARPVVQGPRTPYTPNSSVCRRPFQRDSD